MNLVERAKNMVLTPKTEWVTVDGETHTVQGLYTSYVMILAAIPPIATFIGLAVVGMGPFRFPMVNLLAMLVVQYALGLGMVYVMALIIDALAPNFGGQKNFMQAFKVAAFFPTAAWLGGVFSIIPLLGILGIITGLYCLYVLYLGLPILMKSPQDKAVGYVAVIIVIAIVLSIVVSVLTGLAMPGRMMRGGL
jgi:Yip1 domain